MKAYLDSSAFAKRFIEENAERFQEMPEVPVVVMDPTTVDRNGRADLQRRRRQIDIGAWIRYSVEVLWNGD